MNRGAWQATVHGVARVRHDLVTKPPPMPHGFPENLIILFCCTLAAVNSNDKC